MYIYKKNIVQFNLLLFQLPVTTRHPIPPNIVSVWNFE